MRPNNLITYKIVLTIFCISACATAQPPFWISSPGNMYDDNLYITAIGTGNDLNQAESNGFANLAQRFKLSVNSERTLIEEIHETNFRNNKAVEESASLLTNIQINSDAEILHSKLFETYVNTEGQYYVLVGIDRQESSRKYNEKIANNTLYVNSILSEIKSNDSPLNQLRQLNRAHKIALLNEELSKRRATILKSPDVSVFETQKKAEIENKKNKVLRNFPVRIFDEDVPYDLGSSARIILGKQGFRINDSANDPIFDLYIFYNQENSMHPSREVHISNWTIDVVVEENLNNEEVQLFSLRGRSSSLNFYQSQEKGLLDALGAFETRFEQELQNLIN